MRARFLSAAVVAVLFLRLVAGAESQYLFFNIAPASAWNQERPESFTPALFKEVTAALGDPANPQLRVGLSFIFNTMETPTNVLAQGLRRLLGASEQARVPVLITLDGQNWWQHRPDLWNWWDPKLPGYNPGNVYNVEWYGWSPTQAVKVCWRNWGRQHRVAPAPNLASPKVVQAHLEALQVLVPILVEWQQRLPESQKWIFGGVKLGWEAGIGYNAYYYPEGNSYQERWPQEGSHDPQQSLALTQGLSGGLCQLGYAAVRSAGLKSQGEITREDLAKVTAQYLVRLCQVAHDCGLPREKVFTHQGGTYAPWAKHLPFWPGINALSTPGWSFYGVDPHETQGLAEALEQAGQPNWVASEWWWGGATAADWERHLRCTLSFRHCRFICLYNWNPRVFQKGAPAQLAVQRLLQAWRQ